HIATSCFAFIPVSQCPSRSKVKTLRSDGSFWSFQSFARVGHLHHSTAATAYCRLFQPFLGGLVRPLDAKRHSKPPEAHPAEAHGIRGQSRMRCSMHERKIEMTGSADTDSSFRFQFQPARRALHASFNRAPVQV